MRNRFFFIILAGLILSAIGMGFVTVYFFENQRLNLIDARISESSQALLASVEFGDALTKPEVEISEHITKILKGRRIGHIFLLKDSKGQIIYKSQNAALIDAELPIEPEWVGVETADEYVRYRNVLWPGTDMVLQVAFVVDRGFINWQLFDYRVVAFMAGIIGVLFFVSVVLTLLLLSPLRLLIQHLEEATRNLVNLRDVRPLPKKLTNYDGGWARSDEFTSLISTVRKLIDRINLNYKLTRSWTLQMAHELKTPLAIVRAETEGKRKSGEIPGSYAADIVGEVENMSETISRFLDWAELESSQMRDDLHAIHVHQAVAAAANRLEKIAPQRIELDFQSNFQVIANPMHFDQLVTNLLTNAIKYSPASTSVQVRLRGQALTVRDFGPGIPVDVRERIGQPFNVGHNKAGNGLGLAWVSTVARLYQWDLDVRSDPAGTEATVRFPFE